MGFGTRRSKEPVMIQLLSGSKVTAEMAPSWHLPCPPIFHSVSRFTSTKGSAAAVVACSFLALPLAAPLPKPALVCARWSVSQMQSERS